MIRAAIVWRLPAIVIGLSIRASLAHAGAEDLLFTLENNPVLPGEPVFLHVVADAELSTHAGPEMGAGRHRRLKGKLMVADSVVCEVPLFEREARLNEQTGRQEGFYVAYLTNSERRDNPVFFSEPGRYNLIIHDVERKGVVSNALEIVVRQPEGADAEAWTAYKEAKFQDIAVGALEGRATDAGLAVFRDIVKRFPKSRYAAHAQAALVLCEFKQTEQRAKTESDRAEWRSMLAQTDGVSELFEEKHPLRARLLFLRAVCQARAGAIDDAGTTLRDLKRDFPDGELAEKIRQADAELSKKKGG